MCLTLWFSEEPFGILLWMTSTLGYLFFLFQSTTIFSPGNATFPNCNLGTHYTSLRIGEDGWLEQTIGVWDPIKQEQELQRLLYFHKINSKQCYGITEYRMSDCLFAYSLSFPLECRMFVSKMLSLCLEHSRHSVSNILHEQTSERKNETKSLKDSNISFWWLG